MSAALVHSHLCAACGQEKPLTDFYRTAIQILPYCKPCHNAKCVARVRASVVRKRQQYGYKRVWTLRNPEAKRIHEGRAVFLGKPGVPSVLCELERAVMRLGMKEVA